MTPAAALCKLLLAYHDSVPLTLEECDEAFDSLPPEARVLRADGVMDVRTSLALTWRRLWHVAPPVDEVTPEFITRHGAPYELD